MIDRQALPPCRIGIRGEAADLNKQCTSDTTMHHDQMVRLIATALCQGAKRVSPVVTEWDVSGNCHSPVTREFHVRPSPGKPEVEGEAFMKSILEHFPGAQITRDERGVDRRSYQDKFVRVDKATKMPLTLRMTVRCRKCDKCRALRQMAWSLRARAEVSQAVRTWFGTLTLRPAAHMVAVSRARVHLAEQGVDFDGLPFGEQFTERHKQISPEITKFLKRVRKESGAFLRFLAVAEHHKSGLPHYHLLIHEFDFVGVKHSTLSRQWQLGFEKWRLVSSLSEATYLTKYLSKATVARVRASGSYGDPPLVVGADRPRENSTPPNTLAVSGTSQKGDADGLPSRISS